jgi:hypothetical protein
MVAAIRFSLLVILMGQHSDAQVTFVIVQELVRFPSFPGDLIS